ncbi:hypothetical protein PQR39_41435 [Paraburkholderia sediminicola]|uniref:hypothetical protein n=1 Tax=Paraburkholderia sediminicola TaxID=458836 RepID=UPI0038BCFA6B
MTLDGTKAEADVDISGNIFDGPISISGAVIDRSLIFSGSHFYSSADLSDTQINQRFVLDARHVLAFGFHGEEDHVEPVVWGPEASLSLRNAVVNIILARQSIGVWPDHVDLRDLSFKSYQGDASGPGLRMSATDWFPLWLSKSTSDPFNPQPYEQVRTYLVGIGEQEAAKAVGVSEKNLELKQACASRNFINCVFLATSWATIGYGYELWRAALWSIGFILVGAAVFRRTPEAAAAGMPYGLAYSFDTFIPLIKLRERHYEIHVDGPARYYFYVHKLAGWMLGSFLVAAVSGLTK